MGGFGISKIALVESVKQVHQGKNRQKPKVELAAKCPLSMMVDDVGGFVLRIYLMFRICDDIWGFAIVQILPRRIRARGIDFMDIHSALLHRGIADLMLVSRWWSSLD